MPVKQFKCVVKECDTYFDTEVECLTHEATHAKEIPCKHVKANGKKDDCVSTVLVSGDIVTVTFKWAGGSKPQTKRFEYDSSDAPDVYTSEIGGEIADDGHIAEGRDLHPDG